MDSNKPLSKVQPDLLMERDMVRSVPIDNIDHSPVNNPVVLKKDLVVPKRMLFVVTTSGNFCMWLFHPAFCYIYFI